MLIVIISFTNYTYNFRQIFGINCEIDEMLVNLDLSDEIWLADFVGTRAVAGNELDT